MPKTVPARDAFTADQRWTLMLPEDQELTRRQCHEYLDALVSHREVYPKEAEAHRGHIDFMFIEYLQPAD